MRIDNANKKTRTWRWNSIKDDRSKRRKEAQKRAHKIGTIVGVALLVLLVWGSCVAVWAVAGVPW